MRWKSKEDSDKKKEKKKSPIEKKTMEEGRRDHDIIMEIL